jgi:hypothetical protein
MARNKHNLCKAETKLTDTNLWGLMASMNVDVLPVHVKLILFGIALSGVWLNRNIHARNRKHQHCSITNRLSNVLNQQLRK